MQTRAEYLEDRERAKAAVVTQCGRLDAQMKLRGFNCLFEHTAPVLSCMNVWTVWVNMASGEMVLTLVTHKARASAYKLEEISLEQASQTSPK